MSKRSLLEEILKTHTPEGHERPVTRRQFLAQSSLVSATSIFAPSLLSVISRVAEGATDCTLTTGPSKYVPFMCFDEAGGGSIAGSNILVGGPGGQKDIDTLTNYRSLGLPDELHPSVSNMIDESMGIAFHTHSPLLRGIKSVLSSPEILSHCDGVVWCASSENDRRENPHNPVHFIARIREGSITALAGNRDGSSGGHSVPASNSVLAKNNPVQITRPEHVVNLADFGDLADTMGPEKAARVLASVQRLSKPHIRAFSEKDIAKQVKDLIDCGYIKANMVPKRFTPEMVNPALDSVIESAGFDLINNEEDKKLGSLTKLLLNDFAAACTYSVGGYDYHNTDRATTDSRDFNMGTRIGKFLNAAYEMKKPAMIYLFTDGGISSGTQRQATTGANGESIEKFLFTGDSSNHCATVLIAFNPAASRTTKAIVRDTTKRQSGAYKMAGTKVTLDRRFNLISDNLDNLTKAIVLNYLALHGEEGRLVEITGENPFGPTTDDYIFFNKIT